MLSFGIKIDNVDAVFAEAERDLDCFGETRAIFLADRDSVLNDLHARAESFDFCVGIDAHHLAAQPDAQITLLLQKIKKIARLGFERDGNPEGDESVRTASFVILSGAKDLTHSFDPVRAECEVPPFGARDDQRCGRTAQEFDQ